ncbi:MAG: hypothetical protein WCV67_07090 [Victivallaceae bacterium]|jgi:hypothetical protein
MNKKELILYVAGGIIFFFLRMFFGAVLFGLFHYHPDLARALEKIYNLLFLDFISRTFFHFMPLMILHTFLQGGLLSLLISCGYYKRKARRKEGTINPISKKSLYIAVAIFIGFVGFAGMTVWLGGF